MTPSRSRGQSVDEPSAETIPAPPLDASPLAGEMEAPVESRVESRRRDTIPAPIPASDGETPFDEEPPTVRAPMQFDVV